MIHSDTISPEQLLLRGDRLSKALRAVAAGYLSTMRAPHPGSLTKVVAPPCRACNGSGEVLRSHGAWAECGRCPR